MRKAAYRLCVTAPPSRWAWGENLGELPTLTQAMPVKSTFFYYSEKESEAIWCYSSSYEGKSQ